MFKIYVFDLVFEGNSLCLQARGEEFISDSTPLISPWPAL